MQRFFFALCLIVACATLAAADSYEDALSAFMRDDYTLAARLFRPIAEQGNAQAQYNLGLMYDKGQGVQQDYIQARQWYEKAAAQGSAASQVNLGRLYEFGNGVRQDFVIAQKWYILGAAHGDTLGTELGHALAKRMTPGQLFQARERVQEWKPGRR